MAHGQREGRAEEDHHFAGFHISGSLDEPQCLHGDRQHVTVAFLLRPLVRLDGVLDRQRMQLQVLTQPLQLVLTGVVHPDPGELVGLEHRQAVEGVVASAVLLPDVDLLALARLLSVDHTLHALSGASAATFHAQGAIGPTSRTPSAPGEHKTFT